MGTLKEIIDTLKIIGISVAGITFVIFMIKIATEPEMKAKYFIVFYRKNMPVQ